MATLAQQQETLDSEVENQPVKEHEIMVVTTLIDEKVRLAEEKLNLKKNCREEK